MRNLPNIWEIVWILNVNWGKYLVLTSYMLSTAKVSKSQVDQGELLLQQSKAYNIYSTAAQLTLQNCQMFYNFTWPFHLKVKVLSLEINYAKDRSKHMMTTMAWCKPGHTSSLIDHGAVWDLLPWGAIQEFFGMAMKRILKVMMMEITFPIDENAESGMEVVTGEESSCEDRQSHRQAISHRCSHSAHNPPPTVPRYVTISHPVFTISQPPGVPPDFFVGYFSVHGLVQVSRFLKGYSQPFFLVGSTTTTKHTEPTVV